MYHHFQLHQQLCSSSHIPYPLILSLQLHPVSYCIVSTTFDIMDRCILLNEEYNFLFIFEGGREREIEGPAISLDIISQLDIVHDNSVGPFLCTSVLGQSGSTDGNYKFATMKGLSGSDGSKQALNSNHF